MRKNEGWGNYQDFKQLKKQINVLIAGGCDVVANDVEDNFLNEVLPLGSIRNYFEFQESLRKKELQRKFVSSFPLLSFEFPLSRCLYIPDFVV